MAVEVAAALQIAEVTHLAQMFIYQQEILVAQQEHPQLLLVEAVEALQAELDWLALVAAVAVIPLVALA
jgi:hypothetical protein